MLVGHSAQQPGRGGSSFDAHAAALRGTWRTHEVLKIKGLTWSNHTEKAGFTWIYFDLLAKSI